MSVGLARSNNGLALAAPHNRYFIANTNQGYGTAMPRGPFSIQGKTCTMEEEEKMLTRVGVPVELEAEHSAPDPEPTLICFSHLRWNFVFQRPQHLMSRFAREMNVIFWEEPIEIAANETAYLQVREAQDADNVRLVVPHLPAGMPEGAREAALKRLLDAHLASRRGPLITWYYTPMMLPFSRHLEPDVTVFDAMDELSKFKFAPERLLDLEQELIERADVVFTGGSSLYEAKKNRHANVHCFPSSVDRAHFAKARAHQFDPADQEDLPRPRLGFYGVIDERFDTELLAKIAEMRPQWSFVMVGPVVKISEEDLPKRGNIHYLGGKTYAQLPSYLSGWDVALMPFAMNESTQFISPTKTPEYLAGGKPVVSTPIRDVVRHYGELEGVKIASTPEEFVAACEQALELSRNPENGWLAEADLMLSASSWDTTQARMAGLIADIMGVRTGASTPALLVAAE
jgi:UDP-galactopyranose mutase